MPDMEERRLPTTQRVNGVRPTQSGYRGWLPEVWGAQRANPDTVG